MVGYEGEVEMVGLTATIMCVWLFKMILAMAIVLRDVVHVDCHQVSREYHVPYVYRYTPLSPYPHATINLEIFRFGEFSDSI